jgi:hypothetical protein
VPGGECADPTFVVQRVDIPEAVAQAYETNRTSEVQIQTDRNEVVQRQAEAEAIASLGLTGDQYVTLKAIESGKIGFWVLPEGAGVSVLNPNPTGEQPQTPDGSTTTTRPPAPTPDNSG